MTDLTPGPEMDRAVAKAVGFTVHEKSRDDCRVYRPGTGYLMFFRPSRDIAHAIEALEATGLFWHVGTVSDGEFYASLGDLECDQGGVPIDCREFCGDAAAIPEAACRAILAWAEAKERGSE